MILFYIIIWAIFLFGLLPMILFMLYLFSDLYNKFYLNLVGRGNKWYQNLFLIPLLLFSWRNRRYLKKNSKYGENKKHIAIVLANNYFPENISSFGLDSVIRLVKYLKKKDKTYKIYNKINSNKLKKVINNKNVTSLFLFGHGVRHGIKVGRNEVVYYCEFPNHPKKDLIAQFHCNHFGGKTLSEYGEKPIFSLVTDKMQRLPGIEKQIKDLIKKDLIK